MFWWNEKRIEVVSSIEVYRVSIEVYRLAMVIILSDSL